MGVGISFMQDYRRGVMVTVRVRFRFRVSLKATHDLMLGLCFLTQNN